MRQGNNVNIGLVKDNSAKTGKPGGGGGMSSQHNKSRDKFLHIIHLEDQKNDAAYMNKVDDFISRSDVTT